MENKEKWNVITHLVNVGISNHDGVKWGIYFSRYTDEKRKAIKGGNIGYMDENGKIVVTNPSKHKVIICKPNKRCDYYPKDIGMMIWLEKEKND